MCTPITHNFTEFIRREQSLAENKRVSIKSRKKASQTAKYEKTQLDT